MSSGGSLNRRVRHRTTTEGKSTYFQKYVTHEGSEKLLTYEYHGGDNSLIYKHLLTPMNNKLVEYLPMWLAPNVITLTGLLLVAFTHACFIFYCPTLVGEAPSWLYFASCSALFAYQTLDNLDGKQARRTKTSSPLGLLFDHGCDALNMSVGTLTMACVLQLGATWKALVFVLSGHLLFITATWEEYYCGSLQLPAINGPTEGILIAIVLQFITGIFGPGFWIQEWFMGFQNNTLFLFTVIGTTVMTLMINAKNVLHAVQSRNDSILVAITRLGPFIITNGMGVLWALFSPSKIFEHYPRLFLWMLGLLSNKLVLHLMLAHLCGEEYRPFRKTLVPIFFVAAHCAFSVLQGFHEVINEALFIKEFFFLSLISYVHIVISVIYEVKNVLGIPVFTIPIDSIDEDDNSNHVKVE
uniref:CDPalcohol phosphatidyltransferase putative n=1 Tax=Albugo laibachii Nc14 TaxID=890382 RepID=F0WVK7_9STRA|nr:CDPalcohol phosphatidyltransferase putative [Albugo laibachii Nc14]|eukprot:CCA25449.1 CDPalcohol phosphatidyltransferase putative [Albugo laibachii Nc14]